MKKIITVIILSVIVSMIIFFSYLLFRFISHFKYQDEPFDSHLSYYNYKIRDKILTKLNYKTSYKFFIYKKNDYKIIYLDYPFNSWFEDETADQTLKAWNNWLKKGKRLFIFFNNDRTAGKAEEDFSLLNERDFKTIQIQSGHPLLDGVQSLYINVKSQINPKESPGFFKNRSLEPILIYDHKTIIALEKKNEGEIIYLADYQLFSDKSILKNDNAVLLNNLFKNYYKENIVFDKWVPDLIQKQPVSFIFLSKFPFLLFQLILLGIIFFLVNFKRFGAALDKNKYNKRSILGHLEAVGYFLQKARHLSAVTEIFDHYFIDRLQQIIKIKTVTKENLISEIKKRYNLTENQMKILSFNNASQIIEIQIERELFIKKLKKGS